MESIKKRIIALGSALTLILTGCGNQKEQKLRVEFQLALL